MQHRVKRFIFFLIAILVGIGLGVLIGWNVAPVRYTETGPHTLRQDYKTDYVLMVAELYQADGDIAMAMARLAYLGDDPPRRITQNAIAYAQEAGYSPGDLELMLILSEDLERLGLEAK